MIDKDFQFGELVGVEYSNSGNMLGNMYYIETAVDDDGTLILREANSPQHDERAVIKEFRAPEDLLERVSKIADDSGMKDWDDLPMSEFFPLDASTPRITLIYASADPDYRFTERVSFTAYEEFPEGGQDAFYELVDLLKASLADDAFIREYKEPERS